MQIKAIDSIFIMQYHMIKIYLYPVLTNKTAIGLATELTLHILSIATIKKLIVHDHPMPLYIFLACKSAVTY